jgi:hypothetical protein
MKNDQVQALNYSAHAIEDIREIGASLRGSAPESARVFQCLINMLQNSVKFILPNGCNLIDPDEMRQAHLDLVRLPFPCVAFEAPWEKEGGFEQVGGFQQTPATKRIALCWNADSEYEPLAGLNTFFDVFPGGGVFVVPIYWVPEFKRWSVALGGSFVPYENSVQELTMDESLPASRIANAAAIEAGLARAKAKQFKAEPFFLLPEIYEQTLANYGGDRDRANAQIMLDSRDETLMLIQACSVINCANVKTVDVSAPAALNKKRQSKGKQPFFSYKILQLTDDRQESERDSGGGSHASPRMHLRRGHLRRLPNKVVWVRPAMVKAGSEAGVVSKDYAVHTKGKF